MNRHKFTIYPNEAQRSQIDLLLKLSQIQWNHAVLTRERLLKYPGFPNIITIELCHGNITYE